MLTFIHTADWHPRSMGTIGGKLLLDPLTGLSVSLSDFRLSLEFLFQTIAREKIPLLLIAGDVFDTHKPSMDEVRIVMEFLSFLDQVCQVVIIPGNHDIAQSGATASALAPLHYMSHVHVQESPGTVTLTIDGQRVLIDCLPYPSRGRLLASLPTDQTMTPEETFAHINDGLKSIVQNMKLGLDPNCYCHLFLGHGSTENAQVGEQPRSLAHDVFLPLEEFGKYDYAALGHIHKPQQLAPFFTYYCGSLLRQAFGEEGERKGFNLVKISSEETTVEFIDNPHARVYQTVTIPMMPTLLANPDQSMNIVYRIKDTITQEALPVAMPQVREFLQKFPLCQVDLEVQQDDRLRDSELNNQMSSSEAVERMMEKDGTTEPQRSKILETHLELIWRIQR